MTPEQEAAELAAYKEWILSDLDDRGNWGISLQGAWLARAEIAAADKARLEAEVQALRVDAARMTDWSFLTPDEAQDKAIANFVDDCNDAARAAGGEG